MATDPLPASAALRGYLETGYKTKGGTAIPKITGAGPITNRHIINAEVLKALGPRGHMVNISRGWAVNEADLAAALRNNVIEGAALDVFDEEPYEGTELLALDNLVMTPHFGGGTEHAQRRMTSLVRRNLDAHFANKPVVSPVPELRDMAAIPEGRLR